MEQVCRDQQNGHDTAMSCSIEQTVFELWKANINIYPFEVFERDHSIACRTETENGVEKGKVRWSQGPKPPEKSEEEEGSGKEKEKACNRLQAI